jgi:hypothetical protein
MLTMTIEAVGKKNFPRADSMRQRKLLTKGQPRADLHPRLELGPELID